jgi:hypothetical protein
MLMVLPYKVHTKAESCALVLILIFQKNPEGTDQVVYHAQWRCPIQLIAQIQNFF